VCFRLITALRHDLNARSGTLLLPRGLVNPGSFPFAGEFAVTQSETVSDKNVRSRVMQWHDPMASAAAAPTLSGLEFLQKMMRGELPAPPIADVLGFGLTRAERGLVVFEFEPQEFHYNPIGVVHGGMAGILLDSAMGCCVQSTLPAGTLYTTLEYKVNLTRPIEQKTGVLSAEGRIVHAGSRVATAEGRLTDAGGKIYAHASTTCIVLPPKS
jgi:uncharacterized protein (TIGR00369 family)